MKIAMFGHKRIPSREGDINIKSRDLIFLFQIRKGHHVSGAEFDGEVKTEYKGIKLKTVPTIERKGYVGLLIATLPSQNN